MKKVQWYLIVLSIETMDGHLEAVRKIELQEVGD